MNETALFTYVVTGAGPSVVIIGFSPSFLRFLFIVEAAVEAVVVGVAAPGPFPLAPAIMGGSAADD